MSTGKGGALGAEPVSWGVLGAADIALEKVIPAMAGAEMSRVDAIASRSMAKSNEAARALGISKSYGSYEDLLADPDIEAVYIPLPNHLHHRWAIAAARAGKHVLCEKPLAIDPGQAEEMIEASRTAGVKLMEAFMYRLHPMWLEIRRMVETGDIGDLVSILTIFSYYNDDPDNIRNIAEFGGGAMYDIGCYQVNLARMLFDSEPNSVDASIRRDETDTDILSSAILDFGGRHAVLTCSTKMDPDQRVEILGSGGRIVVEIPFNIPTDIETRILVFKDSQAPEAPPNEIVTFPIADQYRIQADAFSAAIRDDKPVPTPPEDAVGNLAVIGQILASHS